MTPTPRTLILAALMAIIVVKPCPAHAQRGEEFRIRFSPDAVKSSEPLDLAADLSLELGVTVRMAVPAAMRGAISRELASGAARGSIPGSALLEELARWTRVSAPEGTAPGVVLARLAADPRVDRIEEVAVSELSGLFPDDPLLRNQEGWLEQTGLHAAWAAASSDAGAPVRVAIIDGGTQWSHPDLLANVAINHLEIAGDGIDQDGNGFVDDVRGWNFPRNDGDPGPLAAQPFNARHGTHIAGIVGGVLGNGIGIAGAGGNPELILVNAAHPAADGSIGYGYEGILYAISRGADIINCSWRTVRFVGGEISDAPYSEFEALVVRLAAESGALVIAAAGNDASPDLWTTPAGYESVLSVTATFTGQPSLWPGSNVAPWIDVAASGWGVASTFPEDQAGNLGAYGLLSGTSMAAAVTSGVAALVKREYPEWTVDQLKSRLRWTAEDAGLPGDFRIVRADLALGAEDRPAMKLELTGLIDTDGDGLAEGGETIDLNFDISAVFGAQVGVTVETWTDDPWLVPLIDRMGLSSVPVGESLQVLRGLKYWVHPSTPAGHVARVQLRAVVGEKRGPVESGVLLLRPLSATLAGESLRVTASANGVLGQPEQYGAAMGFEPALRRASDPLEFLRRGALIVGNSPDGVSDALLPRAPGSTRKDFYPQVEGVMRTETALGTPEIRLVYSDLGSRKPLGLRVQQRVRSYPRGSENAFVIVDYEVGVFDKTVPDLRWGLALDWMMPSADGVSQGGFVDERFVVTDGWRGLRVEAADPDAAGAGVAGMLVLGDTSELGFSGIAQWSLDGEPGWHIPEDPTATVSDAVLWDQMSAGIDDATLGPVGDRVAIISGALGTVEPGSTRKFAVAMAIAPDPGSLRLTLDRARVTWEAEEIGLDPELLSTGMLRFSSNPFKAQTQLSFALAEPGPARVVVYDLRGRRVRTLLDETRGAGIHRVAWDGRDLRGASVASGVYMIRLETSAGAYSEAITRVR